MLTSNAPVDEARDDVAVVMYIVFCLDADRPSYIAEDVLLEASFSLFIASQAD